MVAGFGDEVGGFGVVGTGFVVAAFAEVEAGLGEVGVREVEFHAGAGGDFEDFIEVVLGATGEEAEGEIFKLARAA